MCVCLMCAFVSLIGVALNQDTDVTKCNVRALGSVL